MLGPAGSGSIPDPPNPPDIRTDPDPDPVHPYTVCHFAPQHIDHNVTTDYCNVTSPYVQRTSWDIWSPRSLHAGCPSCRLNNCIKHWRELKQMAGRTDATLYACSCMPVPLVTARVFIYVFFVVSKLRVLHSGELRWRMFLWLILWRAMHLKPRYFGIFNYMDSILQPAYT